MGQFKIAPTLLFLALAVILLRFGADSVFGLTDGERGLGHSDVLRDQPQLSLEGSNAFVATSDSLQPQIWSQSLPATSQASQACVINCSASAPSTGIAGAEIQFQSSAEATACATPPGYEWSFGDGGLGSTSQNPKYTYPVAGTYRWTMRATTQQDALQIGTIAGGFGEGNQAKLATVRDVPLIAADPLGRGVYFADNIGDIVYVRFINTGTSSVTVAGVRVEAGTVRVLAGSGTSLADDTAALSADLASLSGLAVNPAGTLLYVLNPLDGQLRVINLSPSSVSVKGTLLPSGQIRTLASGLNSGVNGLAVHPTDGSVVVADATSGVNQIVQIDSAGGSEVIAGVGGNSLNTDPFAAGPAESIKLLLPRAVRFLPGGDLLVSDTGHARIVRIDSAGNASLFHQFTTPNPYPSGMAVFAGNVFTANGNQQTLTRINQAMLTVVAGTKQTACFYDTDLCGDGGPAILAGFYLSGSTATIPLAAIDADSKGLFVADQGASGRGRIRFINLTGTSVTLAGVTVPAGAIDTIAGAGLAYPYDGGLATSSTFLTPTGVTTDGNGNLWIADTLASLLRFVNRGTAPVTLFPGTTSAITVQAGRVASINTDRTGGQVNGPVRNASFAEPQGLFATSRGIYVVDSKAGPSVPPGTAASRRTSFVRFINTSSSRVTFYPSSSTPIVIEPGSIARIIGGGEGTKGDGGFATNGVLIGASDIVVTSNGTMYVTDVGQKSVRKVDPSTGVISSLSVGAAQYTGIGIDTDGRLYLANYDSSQVLRETAAGSGSFSVLVSGLSRARDVAIDKDGMAYVTVSPPARASGNHQIVQVSPSGATSVVVGGAPGFSGDDGPAATGRIRISPSELVVGSGSTNQLPQTVNISVGPANDIVFVDSNNNRIRRVSRTSFFCEKSGTITIAGSNPVPQITSISPTGALQNSGAVTLTVEGTGFVSGAEVRWNGSARATSYLGPSQLTAAITAADLAESGVISVTVSNPPPGGGVSGPASFLVTAPNPLPQLVALDPSTAVQGSGGLTLSVTGNGFVSGAIVRWDGQNRATTFVSSTRLTAQLLAGDLAGTGTAVVTAVNPTPGGGISNSLSFTITSQANPAPVIVGLSPASVTAGGQPFTLTVTGSNFISGSKVELNGSERQTTYQSPTQLTAAVLATDISIAGTLLVAVKTPSPGGGVSATLPFQVVPAAPLLTGIDPNQLVVGDPPLTLTVNGLGFTTGAIVRVNGNNRTTTYVSPTQLKANILSTDLSVAGNLSLTAFNPGSSVSNSLVLPVYNRVAAVSAASYSSGDQAPNSIIAAFGLNLATGVELNTAATLPTVLRDTRVTIIDSSGTSRDQSLFFVAPSQINFHLHPETALGIATINVRIGNTIVAIGQLQIGRLAPAIFTQNANGEGVPAAYALRYRGSDASLVPVLAYDNAQSKWVPVPIDLGPVGDTVYLVLFGTGFRSNSGLTGTRVTIRSTAITPVYAGPAPDFIGLDQMNLELPRSLIGAGPVNVQVSVDGKVANEAKLVQLNIK